MEFELEGRDDTKVAAASSDTPEEVLVFVLARVDEFSVGGYDIRREEVIDCQTVLPREPAPTAPECRSRTLLNH